VFCAGELLLSLPVADAHTLSLVWPLPPLRAYYQYATHDYISHILGHEGPGSLTRCSHERTHKTKHTHTVFWSLFCSWKCNYHVPRPAQDES
jgi:hypothetical protein